MTMLDVGMINKLKLRRNRRVILDSPLLTDSELDLLKKAKKTRPDCTFTFIEGGSRDLYMISKYSISKVCCTCFNRILNGKCEFCNSLSMLERHVSSFIDGGHANLTFLLEEKRAFYSTHPIKNCIYISFLYLDSFEDIDRRRKAKVYAKIGHTGRGISIRYGEHERGLVFQKRCVPDAVPLPDNIFWFPTKNDVEAEKELKISLKKYLQGKTTVGNQTSIEIICFDIDLGPCESSSSRSISTDSNSTDSSIDSIDKMMRSLSLGNDKLVNACIETIKGNGIFHTFEVIALKYADDFREYIYRSLIYENRGKSRYFR